MNFLWSWSLMLMGLIPLLVGLYFWMLKRRRRDALRYSSLILVRQALPQQSRYKRHIPFAFFLLALASLVLALGRPVAHTNVPIGHATVILSIDVSRSMLQTDIPPEPLAGRHGCRIGLYRSALLQYPDRHCRFLRIRSIDPASHH
jgi:Ca-activated chloride channel homolog